MTPKYAIGQRVMVRVNGYRSFNLDDAVISDIKLIAKGRKILHICDSRIIENESDVFAYQLNETQTRWYDECTIRPRPELGLSWEELRQMWGSVES